MRPLPLLLTTLFVSTTLADEALDAAFGRDVLVIETSGDACYRFDVWLATEREQQARGLMFVRELPRTSGMLFVYDHAEHHSMWMKNTFIPLDILFIRGDGTIANIAKNTEPQSLRSIASIEPVTYVLELNAGVTDELGIDERSRMLWGPILEDEN